MVFEYLEWGFEGRFGDGMCRVLLSFLEVWWERLLL